MGIDVHRERLGGTVRSRSHDEEMAIALSAIDAVLHSEKAVYASSEMTTGRRLYALFQSHGVDSRDELRLRMGDEPYRKGVWEPYVEEAKAMASTLRVRLGGALVITPAPFSAPGWGQVEYLIFWETVIRTRIRAAYFSADWEYSNGCTFEFAVAKEVGLPTFDEAGGALDSVSAAERIRKAIDDLELRGFQALGLKENLARLRK